MASLVQDNQTLDITKYLPEHILASWGENSQERSWKSYLIGNITGLFLLRDKSLWKTKPNKLQILGS